MQIGISLRETESLCCFVKLTGRWLSHRYEIVTIWAESALSLFVKLTRLVLCNRYKSIFLHAQPGALVKPTRRAGRNCYQSVISLFIPCIP
jgi:hypothetical protein